MEYVIRNAVEEDFSAALAFHHDHIGEFMWPREEDQFEELLKSRSLFLLLVDDEISGLCYCAHGEDRWEFGGIFVAPHLRGRGAAAALGRVALSVAYLSDRPKCLIAHVHEENAAPRGLLTKQLGFVDSGRSEVPPVQPPPNMRRNASGDVVGDVFEFAPEFLATIADWLDAQPVLLQGKSGSTESVSVDVGLLQRPGVAGALRRIAEDA